MGESAVDFEDGGGRVLGDEFDVSNEKFNQVGYYFLVGRSE